MTNRRTFLSSSLSVAVLGGLVPNSFLRAAQAQTLSPNAKVLGDDTVLVVVQMGGGNDGLNTVVPWSDDNYHRVRPTIRIGEKDVLRIDDRVGLNPALSGLMELYKEGHVAIVQGVGYPNPDRSHFRATEIWETAAPTKFVSTGWLGRYLDAQNSQAKTKNPFAGVALGDVIPSALIAQHVDVPAIGTLNTFAYNTGRDAASKASAGQLFDGARPGQSPYLAMLQDTARLAFHGGDALRSKLAGYAPSLKYPSDNFSRQLQLAAQLITSRTGTRIIFVSLGSFDTHVGQRNQQDRLLNYMGSGLLAFYKDLAAQGHASRVLAMTFSEFGRRVAQNAANGTDHGTAMPLFIVGGTVKGGIYGAHPSLTDLDHGDLKFATDFRSVYATILERWLGRAPDEILFGNYKPLAFV
ncbi:MAG: DUF1501 domain-containing protein [Candidatus Eremiobacteraeota bacterium]|nr:DUF1501 domain-containing protein [Candidatus Eremiobacteraeota bacterium]